jgi:hypothetical protein
MGMTGVPPSEFSLTSPGTKIPGQVKEHLPLLVDPAEKERLRQSVVPE